MNETLSLEAPEMVEAGTPASDPDNPEAESKEETGQTAERSIDIKERAAALDAWLTPLIAAHADVIVKAAWMGGATSTLAEAIIAYPKKMVYEDQDALMAEINALIADRVLAPDTQEAEDQTDEARDKVESEPEKADLGQKDSAEKKSEESEQPKGRADDKEQNQTQTTAEMAKTADAPSNEAKSESSSGDPAIGRSSITKEIATEAVKTDNLSEAEAPRVVQPKNEPVKIASEETNGETKETQGDTAETEDIDDEPVEAAEPLEPVQSEESPAAEIQAEKTPVRNEPAETEVIQLEASWSVAETPEVLEAVINEDEQIFEAIDLEVLEQEFVDFVEGDEVIISHLENEAGPLHEPIDLLIVEDSRTEPADLGGQENADEAVYEPEPGAVDELVIESISEVEITDEVEGPLVSALEKIDELSAPLPEADVDVDEDVRQKLEDELLDLLDEMGYEYTEEMVEEITELIIKKRLIEDIVKSKKDDETYDGPHDIGTHEAIKQILTGLAQGKTRLAPRLGKSAIKLYQASEFVLALAA